MPCYSGPNPIKDDERITIWKWAKENGIDHGLPIEKVGDAINQHFFNGMAKPEWITDILSGRKTPFRQLSDEAWRKQYNRRQIVLQAQDLAREQGRSPIAKTLQRLWDIPRSAAVFGHGVVFPVTHGGDLALRPQSWGVFMRGLLNTWTKSWSPAKTERLLDAMKRQPLFDTALRSGLDVSERSPTDQILLGKKGSPGQRAWSILKAMRFELWNHEMQRRTNPSMPQEQVLEIGKNLAEWANHATGSAKGPISNLGGNVLFGPKLTQSKLNRIFVDPAKTISTFANWKNATAGEKAVAWTRLSGAMQYLGTGLGMLAVNQGVLMATNQKDRINFTDPTKGDFLAFKAGGLEWSLPGMHSELKTLGKILAATFGDSKEVNKLYRSRQNAWSEILGQYLMGKVSPAISTAKEIATGQDFLGRPLPWVHVEPAKTAKGRESQAKHPPYRWDEYLLSHGPIPLQGPIKYAYEQLRSRGASAMDAMGVIKALILYGLEPKSLIMGGVGTTGMHISEDYAAAKEAAKRRQVGRALQAR